jgi:hypothetical protein
VEFPYAVATDLTDTYFDAGNYDWFVKAYDNRGLEIGSGPTSTFRIDDLQPVSGQRLALSGLGLDNGTTCVKSLADADGICADLTATPVLDWDPVPNAGLYLVYLSKNRSFQNMVYGDQSNPSLLPSTSNTRWIPTVALPDSQAGVAYYWYVRPCKTRSYCSPDPTEATHAFSKKSNTVAAYEPVSASGDAPLVGYQSDAPPAQVGNDVRFTWDDYLATNQTPRKLDPATGEHSDQAARGYRLQVDTSPAFSSTPLVDDVTVDQTTYTAWGTTYPEGQLYWRIQAIDGSGNGLAWSDAMPFVKQSPRPVLTSPVGGDVASGMQPFRWDPLPFAASYDLQVYKNADTNASATNLVLSTSGIRQVAYTLTSPLTADTAAYVWRVRRTDARGQKGAWSAWGRFTVGGAPPTLAQPAGGAYVPGTDTLFTWQPSAEAASYRFERRRSTDTYSVESVTTVSTRWAPAATLTEGAWEWRVTSLDATGKPVTSSLWRRFTVDSTRPTVTTRTPATRAKRTASLTAAFSESVSGVSGATMRLFRKGATTAVKAKVSVAANKRSAVLNPTADLRPGTAYVVRLTGTAIKDRAGNPLVAPSWTVHVR